jgi:type III restriction enzyme
MNLVKKIQVFGAEQEYNLNDPQLSLMLTDLKKNNYGPSAKFKTIVFKNGIPSECEIELRKGDNLFSKTKNELFKEIEIESIDLRNNVVVLSNGDEKYLNDELFNSLSRKEIFRIQIEETIKQHIYRQNELLSQNIKVLSLFFIDRVANYTDDDGIIKKLFDKAFLKYIDECELFKGLKPEQVREAYFAKKKNKDGLEVEIDTSIEENKKTSEEKELEKKAYELIMKKKELLLSFDEKVSFIFAHSALKEGWDNPNVFQICTLNNTVSETKKRQEIGRGLRLCVNQDGERILGDDVNVLTVIANQSYDNYVKNLQNEYVETGDIAPPKPTEVRKSEAKRNSSVFKNSDFKNFWNKLCRKTKYNIKIDSEKLIKDCISKINSQQFPEPQIVITKGKFVMTDFNIELLKTRKDEVNLKIEIKNTDNEETKIERWFKKGDDLSRILKDERLKGFKIVDVLTEYDEPVVYFGDKGKISKDEPISFQSEKPIGSHSRNVSESQTIYPVFNLIDRTIKETQLTRPTVLQIFKKINPDKKKNIFKNPEGFSAIFINSIRNQLAEHIAENIEYEFEKELNEYDSEIIFPKLKKFPQKELIKASKSSMYDFIQIDSDVEKRFVENRLIKDDEDGNMICYFKFPNLFKINIPKIIGNYVPDWGIIRFNEEGKIKLQLVRETKGTMKVEHLQFPNEKRKIACAAKHFEKIGIDYRQIDDTILNWWLSENKNKNEKEIF